jgi:heme A synthase
MIEFSHRLLASIVGLLVVTVAMAAWRMQRDRPVVVWGAIAAVALVIAQVLLGGATVLSELSPNVVMAHLGLASLLLATLVGLTVLSFPSPEAGPAESTSARRYRGLAMGAALATFALMLTGSYVAGSGASLAVRDWPLMDGGVWPEEGRLAMIHAMHRLAAGLVGILVVYVAWRGWTSMRWHEPIAVSAVAITVLFIMQVFVGATNVWTLMQPSAAAAHLALAVAIWAVLVAQVVWALQALAGDVEPAGRRKRLTMTADAASAGGS